MATELLQKRADIAALYQQQMQALAFELRVAMQAISSNSLAAFEASVAKQETLCAALVKLARRLEEELSAHPARPFPEEPAEQRAIATSKTLQELNTQYASLLKHSGRSLALLSSLCRSHTGHFPEGRRSMVKQQTWSCQA